MKWIVPLMPSTGPNGAARSRLPVENSPVEVTLPARVPVDPAVAADRALHQRDHAFGQARDLFRLEAVAEGDAGHVERRVAGAARQPVLDVDVGHERAAARMAEPAVGADVIAGDGQAEVVAAQRIEARIGVAVGDQRAAVDG